MVSVAGPTRASCVRVRRGAPHERGGRSSSLGPCFSRRSRFRRASPVGVSGISQVSWRSIPCLCHAPRPRPSRPSLAFGGPDGAAPSTERLKASACKQYRGYHTASASAVYASRTTLPAPMQDSLPAGGLRLCREGVEPSGSLRKVSGSTFYSPFQDLACRNSVML